MIPTLRSALGIASKVYSERNNLPSNTTLKSTGIRDVVTGLDLEINRELVDFFDSHNIPCLSEEGLSRLEKYHQTFAIVDPLDGSLNYLFSLPAYCTVIGMVKNGQLVCGGVASHSDGVTAYSDNRTLSYSRRYRLPTATRTRSSPAVLAYGPSLSKYSKAIANALLNADPQIFPGFHRIGSAAHGALQYAAGRFSSLICLDVRVWDIAGILSMMYSLPGGITFLRASEASVSLICTQEDVAYSTFLKGLALESQLEVMDLNTVMHKLEKVIFLNQ